MATITRFLSAVTAVITGLPLLITALFQCLTTTGYDERPVDAINANFLTGTQTFIDEAEADSWSVGYARDVLTPDDVDEYRYFLGGYLKFPAQEATGVIDDICVRAVVLDDNSGRGAVAFAWIDGVGVMNGDIKAVREKLADITGDTMLVSINVGATHTHSAIDTQGLWGNIPNSGRDDKYMDAVIQKTADAIRTAYNTRTQGQLYYASKNCKELFADTRAPYSIDENIHLFRFVPDDSSKNEVYITNFGAHPVNIEYNDTRISGDFPYYVEQAVNKDKNADFIFIQGAIGGGIYADMGVDNGIAAELTSNEKMMEYSLIVADVLYDLAENGQRVEPILNIVHRHIDFEINNFIFKLVERVGLCNATAFVDDGTVYMTSEIGYLEIGENIKVLQVPGEVMPEIVYGNFYSAEEAYNGTEYPYDALITNFGEDDEVLVFGLCNDAVGYIVPDNDYSTSGDGHYEESVSTGSKSGTALSKAFHELLAEYVD